MKSKNRISLIVSQPLLFTMLVFLQISCQKSRLKLSKCGVQNPVKELEWLSRAIDEMEEQDSDITNHAYIKMTDYQGETVFYFGNCHPAINYASHLQTCVGDTLGYTAEFESSMKNSQLIWQKSPGTCKF